MTNLKLPELLSDEEKRLLLSEAEELWSDLEKNNIGGYSGVNRPFYILHEFKRVIEKYGNRDLGMLWSRWHLRALLSEAGSPRQWRTVPVEPTPSMIEAGNECEASWKSIWPAMLEAAPAQVPEQSPTPIRPFNIVSILALLDETRGFAALSPGARDNIDEVIGMLDKQPLFTIGEQSLPDDIDPDLLTALEGMIAWGEEPDPSSRSVREQELCKVWEHARAAIKKARGRT